MAYQFFDASNWMHRLLWWFWFGLVFGCCMLHVAGLLVACCMLLVACLVNKWWNVVVSVTKQILELGQFVAEVNSGLSSGEFRIQVAAKWSKSNPVNCDLWSVIGDLWSVNCGRRVAVVIVIVIVVSELVVSGEFGVVIVVIVAQWAIKMWATAESCACYCEKIARVITDRERERYIDRERERDSEWVIEWESERECVVIWNELFETKNIHIILKIDSRWCEQLDELELNGEKCTNRIKLRCKFGTLILKIQHSTS